MNQSEKSESMKANYVRPDYFLIPLIFADVVTSSPGDGEEQGPHIECLLDFYALN